MPPSIPAHALRRDFASGATRLPRSLARPVWGISAYLRLGIHGADGRASRLPACLQTQWLAFSVCGYLSLPQLLLPDPLPTRRCRQQSCCLLQGFCGTFLKYSKTVFLSFCKLLLCCLQPLSSQPVRRRLALLAAVTISSRSQAFPLHPLRVRHDRVYMFVIPGDTSLVFGGTQPCSPHANVAVWCHSLVSDLTHWPLPIQ